MTIHVQPETIRREQMLAAMRCVTLRLRLLQADVEHLGVFLKSGWIDPDQAEESLVHLGVIDLAYQNIPEAE